MIINILIMYFEFFVFEKLTFQKRFDVPLWLVTLEGTKFGELLIFLVVGELVDTCH